MEDWRPITFKAKRMKPHPGIFLPTAAVLLASGGAQAHHSIAMYDREHTIELIGTVRDFRFMSPHAFIHLEVQGKDGKPVVWVLEGNSPHSLTWDGWSSTTLRPGDEVRMKIEPLRSGAPGGAWKPSTTTFRDGKPIVRH
jgi:hypothetical protein